MRQNNTPFDRENGLCSDWIDPQREFLVVLLSDWSKSRFGQPTIRFVQLRLKRLALLLFKLTSTAGRNPILLGGVGTRRIVQYPETPRRRGIYERDHVSIPGTGV